MNEYEIELTHRSHTDHEHLLTRREWAYNACDAAMQATIAVGGEMGGEVVKLHRVGPPLERILRAREVAGESDYRPPTKKPRRLVPDGTP